MSEQISSKKLIILRVITALLILVAGEGLRRYLASFKKAPAKNESIEKVYTVKALSVSKQDHNIELEGYGVIQSSETINISAEISGVISYVNPKVETGLTINKGDILFKIDSQDYELAVEREEVRIKTLKLQISELQTDIHFSKENEKVLKKQLELGKNELDRQTQLHKNGVGSISAVENARKALINMESSLILSGQRVATAESKVKTLMNQIKESEVALKLNKRNLQKSVINCPATLRVTSKYIEKGQLATPGMKMIVLENDRKLEIPVMISGPDVINWMKQEKDKTNLFESLLKSKAEIYWTESKESSLLASGIMARIEKYDSGNRMIKGLVEISDLKAVAAPGMFCKVKIAGKKLDSVYKVPRVAITKNNQLLTIVDERIKIVKVKPLFNSGDFQIIESAELSGSVLVLNNKLANPVEGLKVQLEAPE